MVSEMTSDMARIIFRSAFFDESFSIHDEFTTDVRENKMTDKELLLKKVSSSICYDVNRNSVLIQRNVDWNNFEIIWMLRGYKFRIYGVYTRLDLYDITLTFYRQDALLGCNVLQ